MPVLKIIYGPMESPELACMQILFPFNRIFPATTSTIMYMRESVISVVMCSSCAKDASKPMVLARLTSVMLEGHSNHTPAMNHSLCSHGLEHDHYLSLTQSFLLSSLEQIGTRN